MYKIHRKLLIIIFIFMFLFFHLLSPVLAVTESERQELIELLNEYESDLGNLIEFKVIVDKTYTDLLSSANLLPRQNVGNAATDSLTFGQLIEKWEQEEPIPEASEEFKDIDGIVKYIDVFFKGHLAKMMGLKNGYSHQYDNYMKQYTVTKPEYNEDEGSEAIFDALFGTEVE